MFPPSLAHRGRGHEGAISALPSPLTAKIVTVGTSGCCDSGQRARGGVAGPSSPLPMDLKCTDGARAWGHLSSFTNALVLGRHVF